MCRNVLIYFQSKQVEEVISHLLSQLNSGGHLILGHSEMIDYHKFGLSSRGHSVYEKSTIKNFTPTERPVARTNSPAKAKTKSPAKILRQCPATFRPSLVVIGASTGGPEVLSRVLRNMPTDCPPVVVAQHIASDFSRAFGERLAQVSGLKLGSFADKTILQRGHLYCADANHHLGVERVDGQFLSRQESQPPINGHRPSVDHLFYSSLAFASETIAILLSGMGRDGADGMQALHQQSAYTLAQSEEDCVVYGMPKEAIRSQAADFVGSGDQIHGALVEIIQRPRT
jgi:two-component system, chemotaxis family, protein-glutamate methylesterase/glutaminase